MTKVKDVIRFYRGIFYILGLWPIGIIRKWHRRGSIFAFITLIIFPLVMCCLSLFQLKNVEDFLQASMQILTFGYLIVIAIWFCSNLPKIKTFFEELLETVYEDNDAESFVDEASERALKMAKLVVYAQLLTVNFAAVIIPALYNFLPFPMWTPEWANSKVIFGIYWALEWLCFNYVCLIGNLLFFSFAVLVIINGYGKFLNVRLSMLVSTEDHDGYRDLVKCIQAHQKFNKLVNDYTCIFGISIGLLYKLVIICIGACIFVVTKGEDQLTFRENLIFYTYITVMIIYIFILSYFGDMIYSTSSQFLYDLFSSDWVDADMKYKKAMIIVMENMKQPVKLSVLFYDSINLKLFQDTVNDGYSMYSVFQNLKKKVHS